MAAIFQNLKNYKMYPKLHRNVYVTVRWPMLLYWTNLSICQKTCSTTTMAQPVNVSWHFKARAPQPKQPMCFIHLKQFYNSFINVQTTFRIFYIVLFDHPSAEYQEKPEFAKQIQDFSGLRPRGGHSIFCRCFFHTRGGSFDETLVGRNLHHFAPLFGNTDRDGSYTLGRCTNLAAKQP